MKKKVLVGMSGGVDSSVAAVLLKEQGYDVAGVTMRMWSDDEYEVSQKKESCCSLDDINDARKVASDIGIPHYVLNFKEDFKKYVVDYFIQEYLMGRTPNPCIACNRYIKFDILLEKALAMGFDYIATGHYANIYYDVDMERYMMKRAAALSKDQSYVLYCLTQNQLAHTLMPLANYAKDDTRELAEKFNLKIARKPDSQDICFVNDGNYAGLIERHTGIKNKEGNFINEGGEVIGQHKGIWHYTIGQRKGLGISYGKPIYVVDIDPVANQIILGENLYRAVCYVKDLNYIAFDCLNSRINANVKIRYNAHPVPAVLEPYDTLVKITFQQPQRAITPGQAAVFYDGETVLGGGTITALPLSSD